MNTNLVILLAILLLIIALTLLVYRQKRNSSQKTITHRKTSKFATVFGYQIHYQTQGQGQPILLIHGIGASSYVWRFVEPLFAKYYSVVSVDLLGFGMSEKPKNFAYDLDSQCDLLIAFLDKLMIDKVYLVGSSMGGTIALHLAHLYPARFPKIAVISPAADPKISVFDINKFSFVSPFISHMVGETFVKQLMKRVMSDKTKISKESVAIYSQPYLKHDAIESFIKSFALLRDKRIQENVSKLRQRLLILWGKKDKIIPLKYATKLVAATPNSHLEIHESAGHHPQEDEPEWVFRQIHDFFSRT